VNDLYKENCKPLKDYTKWKDLPYSWIGRIDIVKMAILPKEIYMLNATPISNKNSMILVQNKYVDQWNRIQDWYMNPHSFNHLLFFEESAKNIRWRKDSLFSKFAGKSGYLPAETESRSRPFTLY
jgi:hypothetical protein